MPRSPGSIGPRELADNLPGSILAPASVTRALLAGGMTNNAQGALIPITFAVTGTPNAYNTWIKVIDLPVITTKGNRVFLSAGPGLMYNALGAAACGIGLLFRRTGTDVAGSGAWFNCGIAGVMPLPTHQAQDQPAAGTYTYSFWVYLANTSSGSITVHGNGMAWCWATEVP